MVEAAFGPRWRESLVERLYRDNRILSIGGGTREIMNEIIAKQMGL
ncbi:acyl-CoA dehydrogenase family protein [Pseudomonas sp.]